MKIAVIRVRGPIRARKEINDTLDMLRLYNANYCVIIENSPNMMGMIKKVKDYVTYGEIDNSTLSLLFKKKGEEYTGKLKDKKGKINYDHKYIVYDNKKYKKHFRLNPPRKGYGRKGIKKSFWVGGALGYRKGKINDLIGRMI